MAVTQRQVLKITAGADGATVLHLQDGGMSVQPAGWIAANRPEIGGYVIDNGRGEVWFARNSLSTLPAVLVEVQRITPAPGELIVFKVPKGTTEHDSAMLGRFLQAAMPGVACLVLPDDIEILTVTARAPEAAA